METIPLLARFLGPLLSLLGQKVYLFVEIAMGQEKPYALTVLNRSNYLVVLETLVADPDGFPEAGNGWLLSESKMFQNKPLQPGQKVRMYFAPKDVGEARSRRFEVHYSTVVFGRKIPRATQVAQCEFQKMENTVLVQATWTRADQSE